MNFQFFFRQSAWVRLTHLIILALLTARCAAAGTPTPAEIKIGAINPLTGPLAAQGMAVHEGIQYAIEEVNAQGGVQGRPIVLVSRDDESTPDKAIATAEELAGPENVVALVGGYVDSLVGPIATTAEKNGVPYVAAASLDERLTQGDQRYFFRVSSLGPYVEAMTGVVLDAMKPAKVVIIYSDTPGATQLATRQKERLEAAGVQVTVFEAFTTGLSDFTPLLTRVRESGAEVIILDAFFADNVTMIRQIHEQQIGVKAFLGAFNMEFPMLIRQLGSAAEGMLGTVTWEPGITAPGTEQISQAYVDGFTAKFKRTPSPLSMHGYAAAKTVLAAIDAVLASGAPLTRDALRNAIAKTDLTLPLERVQFASSGEPLNYPRVVIQIQNGRHVIVYPEDRATGQLIYPLP